MKKTLSSKRKEVENLLRVITGENQVKTIMDYIKKQDKQFIQEAQKELKEELTHPKNIHKPLHEIVDKVFLNKFGGLAK